MLYTAYMKIFYLLFFFRRFKTFTTRKNITTQQMIKIETSDTVTIVKVLFSEMMFTGCDDGCTAGDNSSPTDVVVRIVELRALGVRGGRAGNKRSNKSSANWLLKHSGVMK